jgi:hypothetical protein
MIKLVAITLVLITLSGFSIFRLARLQQRNGRVWFILAMAINLLVLGYLLLGRQPKKRN